MPTGAAEPDSLITGTATATTTERGRSREILMSFHLFRGVLCFPRISRKCVRDIVRVIQNPKVGNSESIASSRFQKATFKEAAFCRLLVNSTEGFREKSTPTLRWNERSLLSKERGSDSGSMCTNFLTCDRNHNFAFSLSYT